MPVRTPAGRPLTPRSMAGCLRSQMAWISVSGENSVMPPWVRHQFPGTSRLVRRLRDDACSDTSCA